MESCRTAKWQAEVLGPRDSLEHGVTWHSQARHVGQTGFGRRCHHRSHKMAAPEALTSIKSSDDKIQIVNQLLLPHTTEWVEIDTVEQAHDAIKTMKVCYHPFAPATVPKCRTSVDPGRAGDCVSRGPQRLAAPHPGTASRRPAARIPLIARIARRARLPDPRLPGHRPSNGRQPRRRNTPPLAHAPVIFAGGEGRTRDRGGFDWRR